MTTMAEMMKKWNSRPAESPEMGDIEAIRECEADRANGTLELTDFNAVKKQAASANGRISLRVPRELHIDLIREAEENGVSLNQYIMYKLAKA